MFDLPENAELRWHAAQPLAATWPCRRLILDHDEPAVDEPLGVGLAVEHDLESGQRARLFQEGPAARRKGARCRPQNRPAGYQDDRSGEVATLVCREAVAFLGRDAALECFRLSDRLAGFARGKPVEDAPNTRNVLLLDAHAAAPGRAALPGRPARTVGKERELDWRRARHRARGRRAEREEQQRRPTSTSPGRPAAECAARVRRHVSCKSGVVVPGQRVWR